MGPKKLKLTQVSIYYHYVESVFVKYDLQLIVPTFYLLCNSFYFNSGIEEIFKRMIRTFVNSKKLSDLQKTFEIHCKSIHITEEMFYYQSSSKLHPLSSSLLYTFIESAKVGYASLLVNALTNVMTEVWDEDVTRDEKFDFSGLVLIMKLLLTQNDQAWDFFSAKGNKQALVLVFFFEIY